jgi:hypothetical protein
MAKAVVYVYICSYGLLQHRTTSPFLPLGACPCVATGNKHILHNEYVYCNTLSIQRQHLKNKPKYYFCSFPYKQPVRLAGGWCWFVQREKYCLLICSERKVLLSGDWQAKRTGWKSTQHHACEILKYFEWGEAKQQAFTYNTILPHVWFHELQ